MNPCQRSFAVGITIAGPIHHRGPAMRELLLFFHLAAAIFWMGGMAFMVLALRPAMVAQLQPPQRLPLMAAVLRRFFVVVAASIAVLLLTGLWLMLRGGAGAPAGWKAMAALGLL